MDSTEHLYVARGVSLLTVRSLRKALIHALYYAGALRLMQAIRLRRRAVVLMYHRVLTREQQQAVGSNPGIVIMRETFARQMSCLKRGFTVLSADDFARRVRDGVPFDDSSCLITFDDGWQDNFDNAWPVLQAQSLPALIFLPVNFVGTTRAFWRETLTLLLTRIRNEVRQRPQRRVVYAPILERLELTGVLDVAGDDPRVAISEALEPLKRRPVECINAAISELAVAAGVSLGELTAPDRFMDWSHVEQMAATGIAFGGHGAEHRLLGHLADEEVDGEIETTTTVMRQRLRAPAPAFSFPSGSWTPTVIDKIRRAGYQLGFTTEPGTVTAGDAPLTIRRINISEDMTATTPMFLARILGLV